MFLHRVKVENWRAIRDPIDLLDLSPQINVIHGPNEAGKSSVMDAICRGFFDRHKTASMRDRQPWGTSLGPTVELAFEIDHQKWKLMKRFVVDADCELRRWRDGAWEKVAQGQNSDDQIVALAHGAASGRGLTGSDQWGLGQVLWVCQGEATQINVGDSQQARLREALKITLDSNQGHAIEQLIEAWYQMVYTPGGAFRGGQNKAEVAVLEDKVEERRRGVADLRTREAALQLSAHELAASEADQEAAQGELNQAQADLGTTRQKMQGLQEERRRYLEIESAANIARAEWERLNVHSTCVRKADEAIREAEKAIRIHSPQMRKAQEQLSTAETACTAMSLERDQYRVAAKRADEVHAGAERLVKYREVQQALTDATKGLKAATTVKKKLEMTEADLASLKAPSSRQMKTLRELSQQIEKKRSELDAASLTVRVEPKRAIRVQIEIDASASLASTLKSPKEFKANGSMSIAIDGVGDFLVRAGDSDAASVADALAKLRSKWNEEIAAFGSKDLSGLESLATQRIQIDQRIAELREQQSEQDEVADLASRLQEYEREIQVLMTEDNTLSARTEGLDDAKAEFSHTKSGRAGAIKQVREAERRFDETQESLRSAIKTHGEAEKQQASMSGILKDRTTQASTLRAEDGMTDAARAHALAQALLTMDAAIQRLGATPKPLVEDLAQEIRQLDSTTRSLQEEIRRLAETNGRLKDQVEREGGEGLYSKLVEALEEQEMLQRQLDLAKLNAEAIKVLWQTLKEQKAQVFESVVRPVRHMVEGMMEQIVGPKYDRVGFDENLMPTHVHPANRDEEASVGDLSFGTQEQLMLLVRLALARLLSRSIGRQCVMLDDPLVNADRARQRAALRILADAAADTQIVIFTCHPVAYEGLDNCKHYDLRAMMETKAKAQRPSVALEE
jgi:exonuclease SbcC